MDLDNDGNFDLLSGSWPGELFLFPGGPERTFGPPRMLKHRDGIPINLGAGIQEDTDQRILISGTVEIDRSGDTQVVSFGGKTIEVPKGKAVWTTGTASALSVADWDGDGDPDLIVGDIYGSIHLVTNEGTPSEPAFGAGRPLQAGGNALEVEGDGGPFCVDWDADGDLDLLSGDGAGQVSLFRNIGSRKEPRLAAAQILVPPGKASFGEDAPSEPRRGIRSKVCATDWNGDGLMDLLVGDFTTQKPDLPEMTEEEAAEQRRLKAEYDATVKSYRELRDRRDESGNADDEELREQIDAVNEQMSELRKKLRPEYENHGWVWLFERRPAVKQD